MSPCTKKNKGTRFLSLCVQLSCKHLMNLHLRSRCQRSRSCPGLHSPANLDTVSCPSPLEKRQNWWDHLKEKRRRWQTGHCYHHRHNYIQSTHINCISCINTFKNKLFSTYFFFRKEQTEQCSCCIYNTIFYQPVHSICWRILSFSCSSTCIYTPPALQNKWNLHSAAAATDGGFLCSLSGRALTCWTCWPRDAPLSEKECHKNGHYFVMH